MQQEEGSQVIAAPPAGVAPLPADQRAVFAQAATSRGGTLYMSGASRSPLPVAVYEAATKALQWKRDHPWDIGDSGASAATVRELFAQLVHAPEGGAAIALTPSCSYAMSGAAAELAAAGVLKRGTNVLVLRDQMSSHVYPWQVWCDKTGATLRVVEPPAVACKSTASSSSSSKVLAKNWTEAIINSPWFANASVVAIPNVHWCDGAVIDLVAVGEACRRQGNALVVDATQSIGVLPFDVTRVQPDFVAASVHKWLLGAYGTCLMYVAKRWRKSASSGTGEGAPIEHHETNREGASGTVCLPMHPDGRYSTAYKPGASRFDSGGRPNPVLLPALVVGLQQVVAWSPERVQATVAPLAERVASKALALGLCLPKQSVGHILGISHPSDAKWAEGCAAFLQANGVVIASRFGRLRVALHVYNTMEDAERLCSLLEQYQAGARGKLSSSSSSSEVKQGKQGKQDVKASSSTTTTTTTTSGTKGIGLLAAAIGAVSLLLLSKALKA